MKNIVKFIFLPLMLAAIIGCNLDTGTSVTSKTGSVSLAFSMGSAKTLVPDISMVPASYAITGIGPDGATFNVAADKSPVTVSDLTTGGWTVTVEALNADNIKIAGGTSDAYVSESETALLAIIVQPFHGYGSFDMAISWNAAQAADPDIRSQLIPPGGSAINLGFSLADATNASSHTTGIPTGYYTMILHLFDMAAGPAPAFRTGAVEVVRIVDDQITNGRFDFSNAAGGTILIDITPEMEDPLTVVLSGNLSALGSGESMNVTASVLEDTGNVIYVWYVNGQYTTTGPSYIVTGTAPGTYRLDVTAFTADGSRAGSTSAEYRVTSTPQTPQSTTAPTANPGLPCSECILNLRPDILPFYQSNGWDVSRSNWDNIVANWCSIDPAGCASARSQCGTSCNETPGTTTAPTADPGLPCTECILDLRPDILPFYQANGWDISSWNWDNIVADWCRIDPSGCASARSQCGTSCNEPPGTTTAPTANPGLPCTECILDLRPDILPFYQSNGWDISSWNWDNIVADWCRIDPAGCASARSQCGTSCNEPPGTTTAPTANPGLPCTECILNLRPDILPFYQANGWDISVWNWDNIVADWCRIDPVGCSNARSQCGTSCNETPTPTSVTPAPTGPTPVNSLTASKLTIHTAYVRGDGESRQFIQGARPRFVKILDAVDRAAQVKSDSPGTQVVARLYMPDSPATKEWDEADARAQARNWWNRYQGTVLGNPAVDYWEGLNEPAVGTEGAMVWYNAFEVERVNILAQNGRRACIGNFSTGTPDVNNPAIVQRFYGAIDAARAHGGVLGIHEYDAPTMNSTNGWLTLRYRKLYDQYLKPTGRVIDLVITECGIDGGVIGIGGGWKAFTNAQDYFNQLKWYDDALRTDSYVLGATIFSLELIGWDSFDISGEVRSLLQDYCAGLR